MQGNTNGEMTMDWKNHLLDEFEGIERMTLLLPSMYSDDWKTEDLYYDAVYDTFYILSASQAGEVVRSVSESFIRDRKSVV